MKGDCLVIFALIAGATVLPGAHLAAQRGAGPPAPVQSPRQAVPAELLGTWVSYVTENWRFRMITPRKGDYARLPLTAEARKIADSWDSNRDVVAGDECKAYGAAALMQVPARFRVEWQDDNTLRVESDAGMQRRAFQFGPGRPPQERTWQGYSTARWEAPTKTLVVTTTQMRSGYLRRNGVPYSEDAQVTEYFILAPYLQNEQILIVTTIVDDSRYLTRPLVVSSHFKREKDPTKWNPSPCVATW